MLENIHSAHSGYSSIQCGISKLFKGETIRVDWIYNDLMIMRENYSMWNYIHEYEE